ncbi:hypothetical protein E3G52_000322 [Mycobacteroides abscessus]|uniref:hypothetical protein n=1 Tax=Mycobacteroides abscessus TaxID=36809 RepID=UPI001878027E|nr:hypothetical protein [Mycobacteroides abscessus]MBE5453458.1 hypothetical protein [Mycobacteroides abscessus]
MQRMTSDEWLGLVDASLDQLVSTHLDGANPEHPRSQQLHDWSAGLAVMFDRPNGGPDLGDIQTLCALLTVAVDRLSSPSPDRPSIPPSVGQALGQRAIRQMDGTR